MFASPVVRCQDSVAVKRTWLAMPNGSLQPLATTLPQINSPADQGISPQPGDDVSPPNAINTERLNALTVHSVTNVGFSTSSKQTSVPPASISCALQVEAMEGDYSLAMLMTLEYTNPHPGEGMIIWTKITKQYINDARTAELALVHISFADLVNGNWVTIDTDVRYAEEAEAVAQAVMQSDSGQTAGTLTSSGAVDEAKLGPVGERGRIQLTYRCDHLYTYKQMDLGDACEQRELVPLVVQLPCAPVDHLGGQCTLSVTLSGPQGSRSMDLLQNARAVQHLQETCWSGVDNVIVPTPVGDGAFAFRCLSGGHCVDETKTRRCFL